jgi:hypothetical protein
MEALELLGSRYIKPEQVAVGPVETLRAQNAATWRVVFIHRVSTARESGEQADLLKLLTTALVRSSEAKRLVLDFGEEQGFWNVVTESEPQCESLRDWLQAEVDGAEKGEAILSAEQAAAMGEFARLFARGAKLPPRKVVQAKQPKAPAPPPPAPKAPEPEAPEPEVPEPPSVAAQAEAAPVPEPAPVIAPPPPPAEPLTIAEEPVAVTGEPVAATEEPAAEIIPETESQPQEPEVPAEPEDERPLVVPDEIPVIVIAAPPLVTKAMAATQSISESNAPLDDAVLPPRSTLPPRSFVPRPPPLPSVPADPPVAQNEPLIPEIVTELPKAVADPPKVVPIDGRQQEPRPEPLSKAAARDDAPLFANSMPKPAGLSKMAVFFIVLGVVALLLILVIVYLSNKT